MLNIRYLVLQSHLILDVAIMIDMLLQFEEVACEAQGNYVACAKSQSQNRWR